MRAAALVVLVALLAAAGAARAGTTPPKQVYDQKFALAWGHWYNRLAQSEGRELRVFAMGCVLPGGTGSELHVCDIEFVAVKGAHRGRHACIKALIGGDGTVLGDKPWPCKPSGPAA